MGDSTSFAIVAIPDEEKGFLRKLRNLFAGEEPGTEPQGGEPNQVQEIETQPVPESDNEPKSLNLVKSDSGKWLWFARYSNKYLDDDYPREIIAEESHLNFVQEVKEGRAEYPELWLHHIQGTTWGKSMWLGYDSGFALAAGYIYPEHYELAESLANQKGLLLSHGMPLNSIVRDEQNPYIIKRHVTREISLLPGVRAANKLTGFVLLPEEDDMQEKGISPEDRQTLIAMGVPETWIDKQEETNQKLANIAEQLDIQSKETNEPAPEQTPEPETEVNEAVVDEETVDAIIESIKSLSKRVEELASKVQTVDVKTDELAGVSTKAARLSDLRSVIGAAETQIDGRTSLAKDGPKENTNTSGSPFFWNKAGWA